VKTFIGADIPPSGRAGSSQKATDQHGRTRTNTRSGSMCRPLDVARRATPDEPMSPGKTPDGQLRESFLEASTRQATRASRGCQRGGLCSIRGEIDAPLSADQSRYNLSLRYKMRATGARLPVTLARKSRVFSIDVVRCFIRREGLTRKTCTIWVKFFGQDRPRLSGALLRM